MVTTEIMSRILIPSLGKEDDQYLLVVILMDCYYINLELEQLYRRNKIGPTCNAQASSWMVASCSRRFDIMGGKDMEFYTKNGSDLCMIYGNESWNDRSSYLDLKLEININALWMGIDCN
ncbi:hypothetical protein CFP56_035083 [Quercus suber]|uniref:Uncharacterized protein n=1 Tax=Quercus suber TaxID=58331 RepID=A0AAW0JAB1_QUESU